MRSSVPHQYIDRRTRQVKTEPLFADRLVNLLYCDAREDPSLLFRALTSARFTKMLGFINYDSLLGQALGSVKCFSRAIGIDLSECLDPPEALDTPRRLFERRIRYWETRPMPGGAEVIVSPADAKMLLGSLNNTSHLFVKQKFFRFDEFLGLHKPRWLRAFAEGDFAVLRLTPEKYHYNHAPVAGRVLDIYELSGAYIPCNPGTSVIVPSPLSRNRRTVTIIDTDVDGGTGAGLVAMVEIAALMIGDIRQCYSAQRYDAPREVQTGMFLQKGQPKSLFRPGSSTVALIFQPGRITFAFDIVMNLYRRDVRTRFANGFGRSLVETEVAVRSQIGTLARKGNAHAG